MNKLLIEIFSEEIPAKIQSSILKSIEKLFYDAFNPLEIYSVISARHICICISFHFETSLMIKGPKITAEQNHLKGFMKKYNINFEKLIIQNDVYVFFKSLSNDENIEILKQKIVHTLKKISFAKSMLWSNYNIAWIRPIHSIACILNDTVLPIVFEHLTASNITYGHRLTNNAQVLLQSACLNDYINALRKVEVIVSPEERKNLILQQIAKLIQNLNLQLIEDESLLNEIVGLVENPTVYLGKIDLEFMSLPQEVLITTLKHHQKYLLLRDIHHNIAPYFIIVSNINAIDNGNMIIHGNEKVLRARLYDAKFFLYTDTQMPFEMFLDKLQKICFHQQIGSMYDKTIQIKNIVIQICNQISLQSDIICRAAELCKNDLATQMVKEFPELQGIVGYYYSLSKENSSVSIAIRDHYKPCGPNDSIPSTIEGCILALADKISTLQSFFAIGILPTSTKDPYALRRAALGIIRIIICHKAIFQNIKLNLSTNVKKFIFERAKNFCRNEDLNYIIAIIEL